MLQLKCVLLLYYTIVSVLITDAEVVKYACDVKKVENITTHVPIANLTEHCKNLKKPCAPKCCGLEEMLYTKKEKVDNRTRWSWPVCKKWTSLDLNETKYADIKIYRSTSERDVSVTAKNFLDDFNLVQNRIFENQSCGERWKQSDGEKGVPYLLESGVFKSNATDNSGETYSIITEAEYFCLDLLYAESIKQARVVFFLSIETGESEEEQRIFVGVASMISAPFLLAVLLVYCLLPQLRNLSGMLLMAYVTSLFLTFALKGILAFYSSVIHCEIWTEIFYFVFLSSFFWLNIMSFDIWWTFRGQRLKRAINRRGELVKFSWYALYGWGTPLALTIFAITIEHKHYQIKDVIKYKPGFDSCLQSDTSVLVYMHVPTGLLTLINIVLFVMTVYNIVLIKIKLDKFNTSSNSTKNNQNRFGLYLKLSMLMGTTWLLELTSLLFEKLPFSVYVIVNIYNALNGVVIFIMFVLNRKTLKMLCKQFNIRSRFIEDKKFHPSSTSRSTTKTNNGSYHTTRTTDDSGVEMYEVNTAIS